MGHNQIRVGLIGCGHLGKIHCKLINEICKENDKIRFHGVYDIVESKSKEATENTDTIVCNSFQELINEIDALIIVTPTSTHFEFAKIGIEKGINLFIEKPVTENTKQAKELTNIADKSNILYV
jgi:predicted dehydrogenase